MHRRPDSEHLYAWQCFACDASNPATASHCATCGFPARATAKQIDAARATGTTAVVKSIELQERSAIDAIAQTLAPLPMWRQALVVIGGLLGVGGIVWLKLAWSFAGTAWSLGAVALGIVLFCAGTGRK